ncbi:TRAP transporter small permease [Faecalicoccus sp. LCP19S3_E3]|uniref:TRAP transporter small permease n=1 Tax=unclassified Faecalicoccus TaxID=2643311 RepID=UPI0025CB9628|nr:TRAP transporter small permease [Faecalicoccus sp.]
MKKTLKSLTSIENFIMVVTFSIMVICSFAQVINRNFFKLPIPWFEEASIYCMIYMALIGTEVGLRDGTQIAVTAVLDKLHGAFKGIVMIFSKVVVLIFSSSVLISAIHLVSKQVQTGQTSSALHLPMSIPYAALVISFAMIVLVQIAFTVELVITLIREKGKESEA